MANKKKKRSSSTKSDRSEFLIMTNGEKSETTYFKLLAKDSIYHVTVEFHNGDLYELVRYTITQMKGFRKVWCVFDTDSTLNLSRLRQGIELAHQHEIKLAYSNPSFEVWLLNHFKEANPNDSASQLIGRLNDVIIEIKPLIKYEKGDENMTKNMFLPRYNTAIDISKKKIQSLSLDFNDDSQKPFWEWGGSTNVYELVMDLQLRKGKK